MSLSIFKRYAIIFNTFILSMTLSFTAHAQSQYPKAIQALIDQGITVFDSFSGPSGLQVYAASYQGQPVALYLTSDNKHVLVGQLFDEQSNNLTEHELEERVVAPQNKLAWNKVEKASWIQDGKKDAPVILYAFMDPNCPYCHRFREQAEPWIKSGKVQVRHIVVGILGQSSFDKAATINGSTNTTAAFMQNQDQFQQGGIATDSKRQQRGAAMTNSNNELMRDLGITGAPAIYFQLDGKTELARGLPQGKAFKQMMGD